MPDKKLSKRELEIRIRELELQLEEAHETLRAIREGEVDAIVVSGSRGEQIFSLSGSESVYRLIVQNMTEAAFTIAMDGKILYCNAQFGQLIRRPLGQIVGHPLEEFVTKDNRQTASFLFSRAKDRPAKQRLVFRAADEITVPVQISASLLDETSLCMVASDLTELENRALQLRALATELTLTEQRERKRLALVLHDGLQQMLVAAKFQLALLGQGKDAPSASSDLSNLIDDCIMTSRSLTAELSPPILHRGGLIAALEWLSQWMGDKHGLSVELTTQGQIASAPEAISVLLFQSVRELLFNVVKHAGTRKARIAISQLNRNIRVEVSDEGVGFNPDRLAIGGVDFATGMGLFSIRERLGYLNGTMSIEAAPDRGSRIVLTAPLVDSLKEIPESLPVEKPIAFSESPEAGGDDSTKIRVVLVDDHWVMRQGLASLLSEEADIAIAGEASDCKSAVDLIRKIRPAVVLMDISMPGMNGIEATKIIHEQMPDVKIIGLSMFQAGEQATAILEAGAVDYLAKTGPSSAVIEAIRKCVRKAGIAAAN